MSEEIRRNSDVLIERKEIAEQLARICNDIRYMGIRLIRDCENCIKNYRNSNDVLLLCNLSAEMLHKYSKFIKQYVQDVTDSVNKLNVDDYMKDVLCKLNNITSDNSKLMDVSDACIVTKDPFAKYQAVNKHTETILPNSYSEIVANCSFDLESVDFDRETVVNLSLNDLDQEDDEFDERNDDNPVSCIDPDNQHKEDCISSENANEGLLQVVIESNGTHMSNVSDNKESSDSSQTLSEKRVNSSDQVLSAPSETAAEYGTTQERQQSSSLLCLTPDQLSTCDKSADAVLDENSPVLDMDIEGDSALSKGHQDGVASDSDHSAENEEWSQGRRPISGETSSVSGSSDRTVSNLDTQELLDERNEPDQKLHNVKDTYDSGSDVFDVEPVESSEEKKRNVGSERDILLNLLEADRLIRQRCGFLEESGDKATPDESSDTELYDVVKEVILTTNTRSKNPSEAKAREAFKSLMEDEDITTSGSDVDQLRDDDDDDGNVPHRFAQRMSFFEDHEDIKRKFGIGKELIVNLSRDNSICPAQDDYCVDGDEDTRSTLSSGDSVARLCDLSTVLLGKRRPSVAGEALFRAKRPRLHSDVASDTSSQWSSAGDDADSYQEEDRVSSPAWDSSRAHDDQEAVNALWDDINNSSDDATNCNDEDDTAAVTSDDKGRATPKSGSSAGRSSAEKIGKKETTSSCGKLAKPSCSWRRDPLLLGALSSSSSSDSGECDRSKRRKARERLKKRVLQDSASSDSSEDGNMSAFSGKSSDDIGRYDKAKNDEAGGEQLEEDCSSKKNKGRRNIRALMRDADLSLSTQKAREEEKLRIKRLQEKQSTQQNSSTSSACESPQNNTAALVLDEHEDVRVEVHRTIARRLKPHQRDGIQFMWDSCFESIAQLRNEWKGSGCILAHCMGLGKTRQALALVHTLFANDICRTKHILVVCPLSTVNGWQSENKLVQRELAQGITVPLYAMQGVREAADRVKVLKRWRKRGGMLVLGYEAFGLLTNPSKLDRWQDQGLCSKEEVLRTLVDPGPDLVICDEGHLLRNKQTQRNLSLNQLRTRRRIVLTGTPLQNNLLEYYCMVSFVKPNLLGTEREFKTNFVNPISNGQYEDSTSADILLMKQRTHVLHKLLDRVVQRFEDAELKRYLPELLDQALFVSLGEAQVRLYNAYLDLEEDKRVERTADGNIKRSNFLADVGVLDYLCTHPYTLTVAARARRTRIKEQDTVADSPPDQMLPAQDWWQGLMPADAADNAELGPKVLIVLDVLRQAEAERDKVLIFSQTHAELDTLEHFVQQQLNYGKGRDYLRMDGTTVPEARTKMCARFNDTANETLRLFIMSTKVGGLGLTLTAANRVLIMSVNWNPSYDVQSVFRVFRFGQTKPVYVYRLIARDTMEERRYMRQVTKLAVSHRVVDKHQVRRHYNMNDFQEMYTVRPRLQDGRPVPNVPEDKVLAKLVRKFPFLYKWHEHQKLLANRPEEALNEQEKNAAWEEFNKKDEVPPEPVAQPPAVFPLSSPADSTTSSVHSEHNYTRPRLLLVVLRTPSEDDFLPTARPWQPTPTPRPNVLVRFQRLSEQGRPQHQPAQVTASPGSAARSGSTCASRKSQLRSFMQHLHRLQDEAAALRDGRFQPNPYAIGQKRALSTESRSALKRLPPPDPCKTRLSSFRLPMDKGDKENRAETVAAVDLTVETSASPPPADVIRLD